MNVGLPGTGLGGIFYVLSALFAFVIEIKRWMGGEKNTARLKEACFHATIALIMIALLFGTLYLLDRAFGLYERILHDGRILTSHFILSEKVKPIYGSLGILVLLFVIIRFIAALMRNRDKK
jgi:hypothetical protein